MSFSEVWERFNSFESPYAGNDIRDHELASVALQHGADPRFFENKIKGGSTFAVLCGEGGWGRLLRVSGSRVVGERCGVHGGKESHIDFIQSPQKCHSGSLGAFEFNEVSAGGR